MINLILFLVQNVALDAICNDTFHNILFCPVSQIGNQSLMPFENSYPVPCIIHQ